VQRRAPKPPPGLGADGTAAWHYLWKMHWLVPERHSRIVTRHCQLQDLLALAFAQVERDGLMTEGSSKQARTHPAMAEIRLITTEFRLMELEMGLTPAAEAKAGVPTARPPGLLDEMAARRQARQGAEDDDDPDDFRFALVQQAT
jgi:P27 family predicted phage terminase small subunit